VTFDLLSLGAGVQSSTLYLLSCEGTIPRFDAAVFADTGWEPRAVYAHLDRLEATGKIPIERVSVGNIREDALDPAHKFVSMPTFTLGPCQTCTLRGHLGYVYDLPVPGDEDSPQELYTGVCPKCGGAGVQRGMGRRQCTNEYKLRPIKEWVRDQLGYPHPTPVPRGVHAKIAIGISVDEIGRARESDVGYLFHRHPLLDLPGQSLRPQKQVESKKPQKVGWTRKDCLRFLRSRGWKSVPKSACVGCPFHGNAQWRAMRDNRPAEWADAVAFDHALRVLPREDGLQEFLHRSCVPLDQAPIDRVSSHEWRQRQGDIFDAVADQLLEDGDPDGCGPWTCRSGERVAS
jgi:hypothetical protein